MSFFWPCCKACGILVPQPENNSEPLAVRVLSPNHWATREFPKLFFAVMTVTSLTFTKRGIVMQCVNSSYWASCPRGKPVCSCDSWLTDTFQKSNWDRHHATCAAM